MVKVLPPPNPMELPGLRPLAETCAQRNGVVTSADLWRRTCDDSAPKVENSIRMEPWATAEEEWFKDSIGV